VELHYTPTHALVVCTKSNLLQMFTDVCSLKRHFRARIPVTVKVAAILIGLCDFYIKPNTMCVPVAASLYQNIL